MYELPFSEACLLQEDDKESESEASDESSDDNDVAFRHVNLAVPVFFAAFSNMALARSSCSPKISSVRLNLSESLRAPSEKSLSAAASHRMKDLVAQQGSSVSQQFIDSTALKIIIES